MAKNPVTCLDCGAEFPKPHNKDCKFDPIPRPPEPDRDKYLGKDEMDG